MQLGGKRRVFAPKANDDAPLFDVERRNARLNRHDFEPQHVQQIGNRFRRFAKAIRQLVRDLVNLGQRRNVRQPPIQAQAQAGFRHIVLRQLRRDRQIDQRRGEERHMRFFGGARFLGFGARQVYRISKQTAVQIEPDRRNVPRLPRTENFARAANFEIAHRDLKTRAEFARFGDGLQPLVRFGGERMIFLVEEIRIRARRAAPDASTQLV